jgi:hypothetical protein
LIRRHQPGSCLKQGLLVFIVGVALNYLWELAQAPLYAGLQDWGRVWWHCLVAALGDGLLIWLILVIGWLVFGRFEWYVFPSYSTLGVMLAAGLSIGIGVEWIALNILGRWAYAAAMPLLPGLNIGLVPVLQMLVLPPLIFHLASRWTSKGAVAAV